MSVILGGRYRLDELVGGGGMGEVWKAHDDVLNRTVAVKIIRPHLADDESIRARLQVEARLAGSLSHPGVVDVYDYGEDESDGRTVPFLVMPFIDGVPLSQLLRDRQTLPVGETMAIVGEVADALAAAHAAGIVHRDLKPANILLTSSGRVMLVDFGIARSIGGESLTQSGALIGTADYLSPEQSGGNAATHLSDVYALGVVAYACLTGTPPFHRDSDVATALAHIQSPVPDLPPEAEATGAAALINSMLAKDPAARPQSAAEVAVAARSLATELPLPPEPAAGVPAEEVAPLATTSPGLEPTAPGSGPTDAGITPTAPVPLDSPTPTSVFAPPVMVDSAATAGVAAAAEDAGVVAPAEAARGRRGPRRAVMLSSGILALAIVAAFLFLGGDKQVAVPNLRDLTTSQAAARLKSVGLKIETHKVDVAHHKAGEVARQSPSAGDKVDKGSTIRVDVASGLVAIPSSLVGMTYDKAAARLVSLGLRPARIDTFSTKNAGTVLSTSPSKPVKPGTTVTLTVAFGTVTSNDSSDDKGKHKSKKKDKPEATTKTKAPKPKPKASPSPSTSPSPSATATSTAP
jgi:tRNA A-37 threonylcarbamoyl transferase component Bud32